PTALSRKEPGKTVANLHLGLDRRIGVLHIGASVDAGRAPNDVLHLGHAGGLGFSVRAAGHFADPALGSAHTVAVNRALADRVDKSRISSSASPDRLRVVFPGPYAAQLTPHHPNR